MTAKDTSTPELDAFGTECQEVPLHKGARILVVSSPAPATVLATALLCRSIMKSGGLFHITFTEPITTIQTLESVMKANPERTLLVVGVDVTGDGTSDSGNTGPILIGSTISKGSAPSFSLGPRELVSASAYALAREKLDTGLEELFLAAAGLLIQNPSTFDSDGVSKEIVRLAQDSGVLQERRGFRIFGVNFLPLTETLSNSISPYLPGISGAASSCERILNEADIPSTRRNMPVTSLTGEEKKRLAEGLALKLDIAVIRKLLGLDFEATLESESSPLRFLSGIQSMAEVAWCRQEVGLAMAIWMGDRARMLRMLLDSYRIHCRGVISGLQHFLSVQSKHEIKAVTDSVAVATLTAVRSESLSNVGRIAFDNGHIDQGLFLVLDRDDCASVIWASDDIDFSEVFSAFRTAGLSFSSTSPLSLLIQLKSKKDRETLLRVVGDFAGGMR